MFLQYLGFYQKTRLLGFPQVQDKNIKVNYLLLLIVHSRKKPLMSLNLFPTTNTIWIIDVRLCVKVILQSVFFQCFYLHYIFKKYEIYVSICINFSNAQFYYTSYILAAWSVIFQHIRRSHWICSVQTLMILKLLQINVKHGLEIKESHSCKRLSIIFWREDSSWFNFSKLIKEVDNLWLSNLNIDWYLVTFRGKFFTYNSNILIWFLCFSSN